MERVSGNTGWGIRRGGGWVEGWMIRGRESSVREVNKEKGKSRNRGL